MNYALPHSNVDFRQASNATVFGDEQCDEHNRIANEQRAQEHIDARRRLVMRFLPFIWLDDQNLGSG